MLGVCTAICAWHRTRIALAKVRSLRKALATDATSLSDEHDFEVACDPQLSKEQVLRTAGETLAQLGVRTKREGDLLSAVSSPWSVAGSPIFHWALFMLIASLTVSALVRSHGLMVSPSGRPARRARLVRLLGSGPLFDWSNVHRSYRVDSLVPHYLYQGIDRGGTPSVSVLDSGGHVVKRQLVYPNMALETGSLTIHAAEYGLASVHVAHGCQRAGRG